MNMQLFKTSQFHHEIFKFVAFSKNSLSMPGVSLSSLRDPAALV